VPTVAARGDYILQFAKRNHDAMTGPVLSAAEAEMVKGLSEEEGLAFVRAKIKQMVADGIACGDLEDFGDDKIHLAKPQ